MQWCCTQSAHSSSADEGCTGWVWSDDSSSIGRNTANSTRDAIFCLTLTLTAAKIRHFEKTLRRLTKKKSGRHGDFLKIRNYWGVTDSGIVTAKLDEQKTDATKAKIQALVSNL